MGQKRKSVFRSGRTDFRAKQKQKKKNYIYTSHLIDDHDREERKEWYKEQSEPLQKWEQPEKGETNCFSAVSSG